MIDDNGAGFLDATEAARELRQLADCLEQNTLPPIQLNEGQLYQLPGGECIRFEGNDVDGSTHIDWWVHPLDRGEGWRPWPVFDSKMTYMKTTTIGEDVPKPDWRGAEHACPEAFDNDPTEPNYNCQDDWELFIAAGFTLHIFHSDETKRRWNIIKEYLV